tara:strand:- start:876 stop:1058 length:183 start_codon:yes stop_codon:yes gene_type:complete
MNADLVVISLPIYKNNEYFEWGFVGVTSLGLTHFDQSLIKKLVKVDFEIDTLNVYNDSYI